MSAVCPRQLSFALTSAPCASSVFTAAGMPVRAAVMSAVSPSDCVAFGLAPAFSSSSSIAALPLVAASESGGTPYRFAALTSAPGADRAPRRLSDRCDAPPDAAASCRRARRRWRRAFAGRALRGDRAAADATALHASAVEHVRSEPFICMIDRLIATAAPAAR